MRPFNQPTADIGEAEKGKLIYIELWKAEHGLQRYYLQYETAKQLNKELKIAIGKYEIDTMNRISISKQLGGGTD